MKLSVCLLLFVINTPFCKAFAQKISHSEKRTSQLTYVKGDNFEGVIFAADFAFPFLDNQSGDQRFTPSNQEIELAEHLLIRNLKSINSLQINQGGENGPVIHNNLKRFARQYFGYYTPEGEKVVYISCLLKSAYKPSQKIPNWLKGAVLVLNGGSNYWQVQANLNRSSLFGLDINGLDRSVSR